MEDLKVREESLKDEMEMQIQIYCHFHRRPHHTLRQGFPTFLCSCTIVYIVKQKTCIPHRTFKLGNFYFKKYLNFSFYPELCLGIDPDKALPHFYILIWMRQDSNPQSLDREPSFPTTGPDCEPPGDFLRTRGWEPLI